MAGYSYHKKYYKVDARNDKYYATEDTALAITVDSLLDNDKGKGLEIKYVTDPKNGTLSFNAETNTYTYTPDANFYGTDYFKYKVVNDYGKTDWAIVKVKVAPANDAPDAVNDYYKVKESKTLYGDVSKNDTDADGDDLTYAIAAGTTAPAGLTLNANGTFTYTPTADADSDNTTVTFQYTASDGNGGSDTATVTIKVKDDTAPANNVAPVAENDKYYVKEGKKLYGDVSDNDSDANGPSDELTYSLVGAAPAGLKFNDDGTFYFKARKDKDKYDEKVTFTYKVTDEAGLSDTATVTIKVDDVWHKHNDHYVKPHYDMA